jgi:probable nitrogen fixation protein
MKTRFDSATVLAARDVKALQNPFTRCLVQLVRAEDLCGLWSDHGDAELLAKFTTTYEQRRAIPIVGDLDPLILWRLNTFCAAVGVAIEVRSSLVSRTMEISPEGDGLALLTTKRLLLLSSTFATFIVLASNTLRKCADTGTKLVSEVVAVIEAHPDVARA